MTTPAVRRRHVFFFSGFDPKGAAYYHRLYADGAARQQHSSGHTLQVGPRERTDERHAQGWKLAWQPGTAEQVDSRFEFLGWDDLVRAHWPKGVFGVAVGSVLAYVAALSSGLALVRVWRQSRRTLVALAYPAVFWLLALAGGALLGKMVASAAASIGAPVPWAPAVSAAWFWGWGGATCASIWWAALRLERRLHTSWLLRIYRFADLWASGKLPDLDQRLDAMAERVFQRVRAQDVDEVLLVGFSVGSMLSTSVLARVLLKCRRARVEVPNGSLSMLTLGQCVPLLGLMPRAQVFRQELRELSQTPGLCWTDYSSPGDWGSFALVDPLQICRIAPPGAHTLVPRMRSPRFHTLFDPQDYAVLKKDKRRLHLQYLMAAPIAGGYDYFRLTAGPGRLCSDTAANDRTNP